MKKPWRVYYMSLCVPHYLMIHMMHKCKVWWDHPVIPVIINSKLKLLLRMLGTSGYTAIHQFLCSSKTECEMDSHSYFVFLIQVSFQASLLFGYMIFFFGWQKEDK